MADGRPFGSKKGKVIVSGTEILGANAWTANTTKATAEAQQFNDTWVRKIIGLLDGSGSITVWQHADKRTMIEAVLADGPVETFLYPDRGDETNYAHGNLVFTSRNLEASMSAAFGGTCDWTTFDNDGLTFVGFA